MITCWIASATSLCRGGRLVRLAERSDALVRQNLHRWQAVLFATGSSYCALEATPDECVRGYMICASLQRDAAKAPAVRYTATNPNNSTALSTRVDQTWRASN